MSAVLKLKAIVSAVTGFSIRDACKISTRGKGVY
jgi:hypothetical protein